MIAIFYKCRCMKEEATVEMVHRKSGEDVVDWMRKVQEVVGADHFKRSPLCMATKMEYAKIPAPENAPFIGGKPVVN